MLEIIMEMLILFTSTSTRYHRLTIYSIENTSVLQNVTTPSSLARGVLYVLVFPRLPVCLLLIRCPLIKLRDIVYVSLL